MIKKISNFFYKIFSFSLWFLGVGFILMLMSQIGWSLGFIFFFLIFLILFFRPSFGLWFLVLFPFLLSEIFYYNIKFQMFTFVEFAKFFNKHNIIIWESIDSLAQGIVVMLVIISLILLIVAGYLTLLLLRFGLSFLIFQFITKRGLTPKISQTEREALLAGSSWVEKEFFTGHPKFSAFFKQECPKLTKEEQDFLNNQTEQLCDISNEWEFTKSKKISPSVEDFLKKEKFLGLVIPKQNEGKGFSPLAHAKVIEKIASHNLPLSIVTMVPNSLGPAELLLKYGTAEQKNTYLSRLARGEDIPCFGLTEVQAGSDASSIQSEGILFKEGDHLKIRLNWNKRWITLSYKATLIGLVVRLKDPERIYSDKTDLGITCVLISDKTPGVQKGSLYDPMSLPIYNAGIKGENVIVSAETAVIGGLGGFGKGWKMLMESLSVGRGISLPSLVIGCGKRIAWLTGTHAFVRKQFGLPIGKFEGVEQVLGELTGLTHLISSVQTFTLSGLQKGIHSSVASALTKYNLTELAQVICKRGMDIMGGAGLSLGERNKIALLHTALPLTSTVEGANILTRTLIVYGQGIMKSHPFVYPLVSALERRDLKTFNQTLWSLFYQGLSNFVRAITFSLTRGLVCIYSSSSFKENRYLRKLTWTNALFGFLTDLSFIVFRGQLKTKGQLTGHLADMLSFQYMTMALLWQKRLRDKKKNEISAEYKKLLWAKDQWALDYCFSKIQSALMAILNNYPQTFIRWSLKPLKILLRVNPIATAPSDSLGKVLATALMENEDFRQELCSNMYFPKNPEDQFQKLKKAHTLSLKESVILKKIKKAGKKKPQYQNLSPKEFVKLALENKLISQEEYETLQMAEKARLEAIQVDSFKEEEYFKF